MKLGPRVFVLSFVLGLGILRADSPPPEAEKLLQQARTLLEAGEVDKAVEAGEKAVALAPTSADAHRWLGRAYGDKARKASIFTGLSWAKKCKKAWIRSSELDPADPRVRMDLIRLYMLAPGIAGGDKDEARKQAAEIGKLDAAKGHQALGFIAEVEKFPEKAEAEYRKAYELDEPGAFRTLVAFLAQKERYPEAEAICTKIVASHPDENMSHYLLGRVVTLSGKEMEKGLASFDRFLELPEKPDGASHADGHWRKGQLLEKLGQKDKAVLSYQAALKATPGHAGAKKELKRLGV